VAAGLRRGGLWCQGSTSVWPQCLGVITRHCGGGGAARCCCCCQRVVPAAGGLLARGESKRLVVESPWSSLSANASVFDTHRDSISSRFACSCSHPWPSSRRRRRLRWSRSGSRGRRRRCRVGGHRVRWRTTRVSSARHRYFMIRTGSVTEIPLRFCSVLSSVLIMRAAQRRAHTRRASTRRYAPPPPRWTMAQRQATRERWGEAHPCERYY
jgi:hypothetical protein